MSSLDWPKACKTVCRIGLQCCAGDRIFHQSAETMAAQKTPQLYTPDYKDKIAKVLSEGASGGRITKAAYAI